MGTIRVEPGRRASSSLSEPPLSPGILHRACDGRLERPPSAGRQRGLARFPLPLRSRYALVVRSQATLLVALGSLLLGCSNPARVRFANEFNCPAERVEIVDLGAFSYRAAGCGQEVVYVCRRDLCVTDRARPTNTSGEEPQRGYAPSARRRARVDEGQIAGGDAVRFQLDHIYDVELVYAPSVDRAHVMTRITAPPSHPSCAQLVIEGDQTEVAFASSGDALAAEPDRLLALARARSIRIRPCGQVVSLTRDDSLAFQSFLRRTGELRRGAFAAGAIDPPAGTSDSAPTPASSSDPEAAMRAWVDSQREVILGCVAADLVIVRVSRGPSGTTLVSLQQPHAGTPGEGCVRAALGEPPAGLAVGREVVHAVRRAR